MSLLLETDYAKLSARNVQFEESAANRFVVFNKYVLPVGLYTVPTCDVLVVIPPNYNQDGNDMLWTHPHLQRANGAAIPQTLPPGGSDNRNWNGREFCRWSRHWPAGTQRAWRPGHDDINSIYRRIEWALKNPDAP
jgi:hypothetical protein